MTSNYNKRNDLITCGRTTYSNARVAAAMLKVKTNTVYQARKRGTLDSLGSGNGSQTPRTKPVDRRIKWKPSKAAKAVEACANTPAVIGKTVRKAKPCSICSTMDDVTITYAVPLDEGGWDSDWNWQILCGKCRQMRHDMTVYQAWRCDVARSNALSAD